MEDSLFAWGIRVAFGFVAWKMTKSALAESTNAWRTTLKAAAFVVGFAAFSAYSGGVEQAGDCTPGLFASEDCELYSTEAPSGDRLETFLAAVVILGGGVCIAAASQRDKF